MFARWKKRIKSGHNYQKFLLIDLACLVCIVITVLFLERLLFSQILLPRPSYQRHSKSINSTVFASTLPTFSLSAAQEGCAPVVFSWQPIATQQVMIRVYQDGQAKNLVFSKKYDIGASTAIWPATESNKRYQAALYLGDQSVSNQVITNIKTC